MGSPQKQHVMLVVLSNEQWNLKLPTSDRIIATLKTSEKPPWRAQESFGTERPTFEGTLHNVVDLPMVGQIRGPQMMDTSSFFFLPWLVITESPTMVQDKEKVYKKEECFSLI